MCAAIDEQAASRRILGDAAPPFPTEKAPAIPKLAATTLLPIRSVALE
jgi:hypothetical protein